MGYTIEDVRFAHRRLRLTVLQDWKRLKREAVEEAIAFAAKLVSERFQREIVAQVKQTTVTYWQLGDDELHELEF